MSKELINRLTLIGRLNIHIFGAPSEFEIDLLKDRTKTTLNSTLRCTITGGQK